MFDFTLYQVYLTEWKIDCMKDSCNFGILNKIEAC